jgi:hypothetical protein
VPKSRPSAAEAKRLTAKLVREAEQQRQAPAPTSPYLQQYRPLGVSDAEWDTVGPIVRDCVARAGFAGEESIKKHCAATSAFLVYRHRRGDSLDIAAAMTHEAVDQFYVHGLGDMTDRSKADYRSRLHSLASRVNPGLTAPTIVSTGYVCVRPGYAADEEAAIRRVALRQRLDGPRRKLCIAVGLVGGAGIDPQELSMIELSHVDDRGDEHGIWVTVPGVRGRSVVVRRNYEELVRIGITGLKPGDPALGRIPGRSGAASQSIEGADLHDCPKIDFRRLRTTWLTWLVTNPVPLNVIMAAAGLTSARTLTDLMRELPQVDPTALLRDGRVTS